MSAPSRAREALGEARLLSKAGYRRAAVSRAYFAAFYAAREAVQAAGSDAGSHRGVASEFSRLVVRPGLAPVSASAVLRRLAASRAEADYDDGDSLTPADVARLIADAEGFVLAVEGAAPETHSPAESLPKPAWQALTADQKRDLVAQPAREMDAAAENLEFEKAAELRDSISQIEATLAA